MMEGLNDRFQAELQEVDLVVESDLLLSSLNLQVDISVWIARSRHHAYPT